MNQPIRIVFAFISMLVLFFISFGFYLNSPDVPPLQAIQPVTRTISAARTEYVSGKNAHYWIKIRLSGVPVMLSINKGNLIGSNSREYQNLVQTTRLGDEVTVWAIPEGPGLVEAMTFTEINHKPLHELHSNVSEKISSGLGAFQEKNAIENDKDILHYEVIQMTKNGQLLFSYDRIAEKKARGKKMFYWLSLGVCAMAAYFGIQVAIILGALVVVFLKKDKVANANEDMN